MRSAGGDLVTHAIVVAGLAVGLAACGGGSSPAPGGGAIAGDAAGRARENEKHAQESLSEPNKAEARAWLADPAHALFEGDRAEVVKFVEELYQQGAPEVYVTGIETIGETPVTASLVVVLPTDKASRAKVLESVNKLLSEMDESPLPDVGQKHVFIALDQD